jgi:Tfp pilus assembly protein FimV
MTTMTLDTMFSPALGQSVSRPRSTVRLTRRGRIVVVVAALLVAFAVGVFVTAAGSVATQRPGTPEPTRIVQVGSGDTLWGIASELADGGDVRSMMEEIKQLNALESGDLQAGQRLVVPAD